MECGDSPAFQSAEGSIWSRTCREGEMCRCKSLTSRAWGSVTMALDPKSHFWQLQDVSVKTVLSLDREMYSPVSKQWPSFLWWPESSLPPAPLPPPRSPSHQPELTFSGGHLSQLLCRDAQCHPQRRQTARVSLDRMSTSVTSIGPLISRPIAPAASAPAGGQLLLGPRCSSSSSMHFLGPRTLLSVPSSVTFYFISSHCSSHSPALCHGPYFSRSHSVVFGFSFSLPSSIGSRDSHPIFGRLCLHCATFFFVP